MKVLLPTPGGPVMPTRIARPLSAIERVEDRLAEVAIGVPRALDDA